MHVILVSSCLSLWSRPRDHCISDCSSGDSRAPEPDGVGNSTVNGGFGHT